MNRCRVCVAALEGRRHALTCSASCRREAARVRAILAGAVTDGYATLGEDRARYGSATRLTARGPLA